MRQRGAPGSAGDWRLVEVWGLEVLTCCTRRGLTTPLCPPDGGAHGFSTENRDPSPPPDWSQSERLPFQQGGGEQGQGCKADSCPPPVEMFLDQLMVSGTSGVQGEGGGWAKKRKSSLTSFSPFFLSSGLFFFLSQDPIPK